MKKTAAVARIRGSSLAPNLQGTVRFLPCFGCVRMVAEICGLPESDTGFFALHIHEKGSCQGAGFPNTGGHYNPEEQPHPRHAGDLPPLLRRRDGSAWLAVATDRFSILDVIGRSVVIHRGQDDFKTQPSGDAGEKLGCGMIVPMG